MASTDDPLRLDDLIKLLASANVPATGYSGLFYERGFDAPSTNWRVWRLRDLGRVEDPPGHLQLIVGEDYIWTTWPGHEGMKRLARAPGQPAGFDLGRFIMLDPEEYWAEWLGFDPDLVATSLHQTVHQGRAAWRFTAPWVKGGTPVMTVDAEMGLVVRSERDDVGVYQEWSDLTPDPALDARFFIYGQG